MKWIERPREILPEGPLQRQYNGLWGNKDLQVKGGYMVFRHYHKNYSTIKNARVEKHQMEKILKYLLLE